MLPLIRATTVLLIGSAIVALGIVIHPCHAQPRPPQRHRPRPPVHSARPPSPVFPARRARPHGPLLTLPLGHVMVSIGGTTYYRHGYRYYRRAWSGGHWVYVEIAPPSGGLLSRHYHRLRSQLSSMGSCTTASATRFTSKRRRRHKRPSLRPAAPSIAVRVCCRQAAGGSCRRLAAGHRIAVVVNGTTYRKVDDVYYLPVRVGEASKYVVVEAPR